MSKVIYLNKSYTSTRLGKEEKQEIVNNQEGKLNKVLFLPKCKAETNEGGLRTEGYFKKSHENNLLISIITVIYNGEKYLEETILSVLNQTYDNVEYIIIDGGSIDRTIDIIKKYEKGIDYWVSERDEGIYDAWNKGVKLCQGKWIGFLSAGDCYLPDAIANYVSCITQFENIDYISSKNILCSDKNKSIRTIGSAWKWDMFKRFMNVAHVGSLHNRMLFDIYGLYDTSFRICGDYEFLLRAGSSLKAVFLNQVTCTMKIGGVSDSNIDVFKETYKAKRTHKSRGTHLAKIDMFIAIMKWLVRKKIWY